MNDVINQESKTFDRQNNWSLSVDNKEQVTGHTANLAADRFSSSISSWSDYADSRSLFPPVRKIEEDLSITPPTKEKTQKTLLEILRARIQKARLKVINRLTKTATSVKKAVTQVVDTIASYISGNKSEQAKPIVSKANAIKKLGQSNAVKSKENVSSKNAEKTEGAKRQEFENKDIEQIETDIAIYHSELEQINPNNVKKMFELICKICIQVNSLRGRWTQKEIEQYKDYLEQTVKKKMETMKDGRFWNWVSFGVQLVGTGFALAPLWSGAAISAGFRGAGPILENLGKASQSVSSFGGAIQGIDQAEQQKKGASIAWEDHVMEQIRAGQNLRTGTTEKIHGSSQQLFEMWRTAAQADKAAKNAATAA